MGEGPAGSRPSRKAKLRRLVAAPFRFLLKDELARLALLEATLVSQLRLLREEIQSGSEAARRDWDELRQAYLATRAEFEQVRDSRVPQVERDLTGLQEAFSRLQAELEVLRDGRLPRLEGAQAGLQQAHEALQRELEVLRDERLPQLEGTQARLQQAHEALQRELEHLRDHVAPQFSASLSRVQQVLGSVQALAEEVRDQRLPAAVARADALLARLGEELSVVRGLLDRLLVREPLSVPPLEAPLEQELPQAVRQAWLEFANRHRGSREEILGRASDYPSIFRHASPVLDVGCGRGELLQVLAKAGIEAFGVDVDPAAVAACRSLGLKANLQDALEALRQQEEGSLGGVAAVHVVEHLPAGRWMELLVLAARALRSGGVLAVESPNPETLRVGAGAFWLDPTHVHPVHPEALRFVAEAVGLEVVEVRYLRPFPQEQQLAPRVPDPAWRPLMEELDRWLSGPRDYLLVARKPANL